MSAAASPPPPRRPAGGGATAGQGLGGARTPATGPAPRPAPSVPNGAAEERYAELHFAPAPAIHVPVPGPRARRMLAEQAALESRARAYPRAVPLAIAAGRGATVRDVDGNTYVDCFAGAGALALGHGHPAVARAATAQQQRLVHALDWPTAARLLVMRRLKQVLPGTLRATARVHFGGPTGSDAVEAAVKLVRAHTGRRPVWAFAGSYHGTTAGAQAVTDDGGRRDGPADAARDARFLPYPYCYRCPLGLRAPACGVACAEVVERALADPGGGGPPAAVIVEPVQGEGGTVVPPPGWLARVRAATRRHGVALVADEVQTGLGRTGAWWACDHDGVTPDVVVVSKALGGIGYPLAAIAYDEALDTWSPGAHIGTFRGHQVGMAAGAAAIEVLRAEALPARARELGELALSLLEQARTAHELAAVGEVRGRGLMIGVELVRDRDTRAPWPELAQAVRLACCERGLLIEVGGRHGNVARLLPPLVITRTLWVRGIEIFVAALDECERREAGRGERT